MTRVLITRPEQGATRTLNTLKAKGIDAISIPLTEITPLMFEVPDDNFDALVITSQNAIANGAGLLAQHKAKPIFAVGERTAGILQTLGHQSVQWAQTAQDLLPFVFGHNPKNVLYICGQTRKPELEIALSTTDIRIFAIEVYAALKTKNAPEQLVSFFMSSENSIVLFHAASAAEAFILAMRNQILPNNVVFLCMSPAIAAILLEYWQNKSEIAKCPDDTAMIHHLDKMLAQNHLRQA